MKSIGRFSKKKTKEDRRNFFEGEDFLLLKNGAQEILSDKMDLMQSANQNNPCIQYGLGIFEGVMGYKDKQGKIHIFRFSEHIDRLFRSAQRLGTEITYTKDQIRETMLWTAQQFEGSDCKKIYFRPSARTDVTWKLISVKGLPFTEFLVEAGPFDYLQKDMRLIATKEIEKNSPRASRIDAKITGQYSNGGNGVDYAKERGFDDTLMTTSEGNLTELSGANVMFISKDGKTVVTPPSEYVFAGLTRDAIIQILQIEKGITVQERDISIDELEEFGDGLAIGTAAEVKRISQINDIHFGPQSDLAKFITTAYADIVRGNTENYKGHELYKTWRECE